MAQRTIGARGWGLEARLQALTPTCVVGNRKVLPRKGLYERPVAVRRGVQVPSSQGVLLPQQVLG